MHTKTTRCNEHKAKQLALTHFGIDAEVSSLPGYIDLNFLLTWDENQRGILKIANPDEPKDELLMQNALMDFLTQHPLAQYHFPKVHKNQENDGISDIRMDDETRHMRLLSFVDGCFYGEHQSLDIDHLKQLGEFVAKFTCHLSQFDHPSSERYLDWDLKHAVTVINQKKGYIKDNRLKTHVEQVVTLYQQQVTPFAPKLKQSVLHNDINDFNLLLSHHEPKAHIKGVIDFGDMVKSFQINELAIAASYALLHEQNPIQALKTLVRSYHQVHPITATEVWVLFPLICARLATSVCNSAQAIANDPTNTYLLISAKPVTKLLISLMALDAKSIAFELQQICQNDLPANPQIEQILAQRKRHLFATLSVSYQTPLLITRGQGQFLLDDNNQAYLDMVNNVCHVGHCHPDVVAAGQQQMALLNTNTRYLHPNITHYSEALLATFPEQLSVVMFVNSGSEANELALRLMHCYRQTDELIVVNGAYHGHTNKAIDISPYKFNGPGGDGAKEHVHIVPMPDPYRGEFKGMDERTGSAYAKQVEHKITQIEQQGKRLGGFICESLQGVGGNLIMPDGYLKDVYQAVRNAGGICIADEVQVGFGRVGKHWWAFQSQGVIPDIVTLGKPMGNGHPLAAVVTTPDIAAAFVTGMEYFNTFGGNPVSCAIGQAVLDTIENESLREHADTVGNYLMMQLRDLQAQFPLIGDVRGLGLFIGVELVKDTELTPAKDEAKYIIEALKHKHILLSLDGPHNNVLKIKPPMVFNQRNADYFVNALSDVLKTLNQS